MNLKKYIGLPALLLIIVFPIFSQLDTLPIQEWDEARLAYNALEMYQSNGNPLVVTFDGQPEMWSTKPPLMIWLQVISMKIIGVSELALRLPSALAALASCLLLYWFFARKFNKPLLGILVATLLVTCGGYIRLHGTRTGDYDSLLTFFVTGYSIFYFLYFEEKKNKFLYLLFIFMALGVLTKSVSAVLFLPAMFFYLFINKKHFRIFLTPHLYIGIAVFITVAIGYYLLREHYNPGYIDAVMENELLGRYSKIIEDHTGAPDYYLQHLLQDGIHPALWFAIPLGAIAGIRSVDRRLRRLTAFSLFICVSFLFIISSAQTKLNWYDMPVLPWLAVLAGIFIYSVYKRLAFISHQYRSFKYDVVPVAFVIAMLLAPYITILQNLNVMHHSSDEFVGKHRMAVFMKDAKDGKHNIDGYTLIVNSYSLNIRWYETAFFKGKVQRIEQWEMAPAVKPGMIVASGHDEIQRNIENIYITEYVRAYNGVNVYKIHGIR
jgi:4-amino-4-deoxy-L-arabinose transferase-like glycosyltransferase